MGLSNYPPGHPTGVSHGTSTEIYYCENCNMLLEKRELIAGRHCPQVMCAEVVERAQCERCEKPATHIDIDRAVNACEAFCDEHGM